jgi:hypothetical protein
MLSAVPQGTVLFSTTIVSFSAAFATRLVAASSHPRSEALPAPRPVLFVGVFTPMKTTSASLILSSILVEKKRFGLRVSVPSRAGLTSW